MATAALRPVVADMGTGARRWLVRTTTALVVIVGTGLLLGSALAGAPTADDRAAGSSNAIADDSASLDPNAPVSRGLTVVTTQGFYTGTHPGARDVADLLAFDADGDLVYQNSTWDVYFDVDPVPGTTATVEYVAARRLGGPECERDPCSLNLVERLNLTTGEVDRVYDAVTPQYDTGRWHDVDRLNETHLVVADIVNDRVFVVDVRTDRIAWQWNASDHYPPTVGGGVGDWTHVNDVEVLADGRIMVSLRNLDSVVFLTADGDLDAGWTLGADDRRDVLFEQHNPDFLPAERGGPAVLVADSENNRVVEYRREAGRWEQAWSWRDRRLQWPRDADRLRDGRTLVADSHGDRVLEVAPDGTVVWAIEVGRPYDAERLGTGDESAEGYAAGSAPTATGAGAPPAADQRPPGAGGVLIALKDALPAKAVNGLLFVAPPWAGFGDLLVAGVILTTLLAWLGVEWYWSARSISRQVRRLRTRFG